MSTSEEIPLPPEHSAFVTTHWSVVKEAQNSSGNGEAALEQVCRTYWYPLYAYVRRQGRSPEEAQDLTQSFFARLLEKGYLAHADPQRGKFRSFLLTSLKRFLINEWEKLRSEKRGGAASFVDWQEEQTESRYLAQPTDNQTPETLFEKQWALTLLEQVLSRLQEEFKTEGKASQFEKLKLLLWGSGSAPPYTQVAMELGTTEGALKVTVHRLRQRYRDLLREEVSRTVTRPEDIDEELRHLLAAIST